ncbi:MAG: sulfatase/phosphatase domain-containing protein, partial [Candidatus Poribacteria bacterium]
PADYPQDQMYRELVAQHHDAIRCDDKIIGGILARLKTDGLLESTIVIYFSDHGDYMGSHGVFNTKEHPHEESVRIPAIFHWPGVIPAQGSRPEMFGLVDMAPTTLGLIGVEPPAHVQGADFSPALRDDDFTGPDAVLLEMCGNPRWGLDFLDWRGVVTEGWKYAHFETGHEMLFDLNADPHEQTNLAETNTEMRDTLKARLLELLRDTREPYFDVLIEHGVQMATPVLDVSGGQPGGIAPTWDGTIQFPDS